MSGRKRHTPEQTVAKLREADALLNVGQSLARVIQHLGVSEATFHRWRNQYGEFGGHNPDFGFPISG